MSTIESHGYSTLWSYDAVYATSRKKLIDSAI